MSEPPDPGEQPTVGTDAFERPTVETDPSTTGVGSALTLPGPPVTPLSQLDDYTLVRRVGEGGMGEVYEAEQLRPVRRTVAIKLVKVGLGRSEFAARFESERQALAMMDHSNIAKIFDAGTTREGHPFFSMEFVRGVPITDYSDRARLPVADRLKLFLDVCHGVGHAHQKGVIHRDLKPSNVLVTLEGDQPTPKIIDFGVAKATGEGAVDGERTMAGQLVGTPIYMSPEQIAADPAGLDTRTDVYALGMLLYRLISGMLPFEEQGSARTSIERLRHQICELPPPLPSGRVKALGESASEIAKLRGTTPAALVRQLRGDLDWVALKALEKDRNRRYGSAGELAADIVRHLENRPVVAGPPSRRYRFAKFVRRHRVGVTAAAAAVTALVAGTTVATVGLFRALEAEAEARQESATANRVTEFLIELYRVSDPSEARGNSVTARELLDRGADRIRTELEDEPFVRTRLLYQMGRVYQALGLYPNARDLMELSLKTAEEVNDDRLAAHNILTELAQLSRSEGRIDEAFEYARRALSQAEASPTRRDSDVAGAMLVLGQLHRDRNELDEAGRLLGESLRLFEASPEPDEMAIAWTLYHLGWLHQLKAEYTAAVPVYERALSMAEKRFAADDPLLAFFLNDVAVLYGAMGDHVRSESFHRRALAVREKALDPTHPAIADTLQNIGSALWYQRRITEARPYYERALAIRRERLGPEHRAVAGSLSSVALVYRAVGDFERARPLYEEALRISEKTEGPEHPGTGLILSNIGNLLARIGDYPAAEAALGRALGIAEKALGPEHPRVAEALGQLSYMHIRRGDRAAAVPLLERALAIRERALGSDHEEVAAMLHALGLASRSKDRLERAARLYEPKGGDVLSDVLWDLAWLEDMGGNRGAAQELSARARTVLSDARGAAAADTAVTFARSNAQQGYSEHAVYKLRQALELGLTTRGLGEEEVFSPLRADRGFQAVVAELERRAR